MDTNNFILNDIFKENAKVYQTKPVRATKYQPGMETGWVVYMSNKQTKDIENQSYEGMKFFDTEQEAWEYIKADNKQYIKVNGVAVEIEVDYDAPVPVLHRKETNPEKKNSDWSFGEYALLSDETYMYDFYILESNYETPDKWIIQDADGTVRVWDHDCPECCNELFFGKDDDYICEKVADDTYIKVAV